MPPLPGQTSLLQCTGSLGCRIHGHVLDADPVAGEKLPDYSEFGPIVPTLPTQNDRYDRQILVQPEYMTIPRGLHSSISLVEPPYLATGWSIHMNPEGSPYHLHAGLHVVSDLPGNRTDSLRCWAEQFEAQARALGLSLPTEYELYLNPDAEGKTCKYYFVDHVNQTVFWLEDIDPYRHDIELPAACSVEHIKYALQEQYWKHCEYFPHRPVAAKHRNELIGILKQARADLLTSTMCTFPHTADECKEFLQIIESDDSAESNEYTNWIIARLWVTVSRHRYHTFYGEDFAKISLDQQRYDKAAPKRSAIDGALSVLFFYMPRKREQELKLLFVDEIAFSKHWRSFISTVLDDGRESCAMVPFISIGTASTLRHTNTISAAFASFSSMLALGSIASALLLSQRYAGAEKHHAINVAEHLSQLEHPTYGYAPVAAIYCLPRALMFWSTIFLTAHFLGGVLDLKGLIIQAPAIAFCFIFMMCLIKVNSVLGKGYTTSEPVGK
ncbi:hypothetical protein C8Q77DRAFT_1213996 [Trametes polyzona]|nr:hypothetical protein C8Q77DRAFT_1213996 [Trametes polyzona]